MIIEILSRSNTAAKINRQTMIAISAGTEEFWVVDADKKTVHVTTLDSTNHYTADDMTTPANQIFTI